MARKLKQLRQDRGLSQSQLAEKAKLNVRTLQHYEQGSKDFDHARIDTILRVCLALNCTIDEILDKEEYVELFGQYKSLN